MANLQAQAEAVKLGRLLDSDAQELAFLHDLPVADTRAFRQSISDSLFDAHRSGFVRLAKLSNLLPAGVAARLSRKALGPMLSARVTGELKPKRAVVLAKKLPADFLAQLSLDLDPRRAESVIAAMPEAVAIPVALELLTAREYVTMAQFVDALDDNIIAAVTAAIDSDEALLRIGFFVESDQRLAQLIALLPQQRLDGTVAAAVKLQLWPEVLNLTERVGGDTRLRIVRSYTALGDDAQSQLLQAAQQQQLWPQVIGLYASLSQADQIELGQRARQTAVDYEKLFAAAEGLGLADELTAMQQAYQA